MNNEPANNNSHAQKLSAEIKKTFTKLSDADIALQATSPDKFYEAVKTKQGIERADAEKTVKKLDSECAAACSTNKASAPVSKAS